MNLTYFPRALLWASLTCLAIVGSGCGSDDPDINTSDASDESTPGEKDDASTVECSGSQTKSCSCASAGSGRRTCKNNKFGACLGCPESDAGKPPSGNNSNLCKAGYYKGGFSGTYNPGVFGFGFGPSQFQVMINGVAFKDIPPLSFTLEENSSGPAGEFYTFTVGDGCMTGSAQAVGTDNPFVARISGELDCATGFFKGNLNGHYTLLNFMGLDFNFSGPLDAQFELPQKLVDGEWMVQEPPALVGGAAGGGMGMWNAEWESAKPPSQETDPCANIPLADGGMPGPAKPTTPTTPTTPKPDAGVRDAGT